MPCVTITPLFTPTSSTSLVFVVVFSHQIWPPNYGESRRRTRYTDWEYDDDEEEEEEERQIDATLAFSIGLLQPRGLRRRPSPARRRSALKVVNEGRPFSHRCCGSSGGGAPAAFALTSLLLPPPPPLTGGSRFHPSTHPSNTIPLPHHSLTTSLAMSWWWW